MKSTSQVISLNNNQETRLMATNEETNGLLNNVDQNNNINNDKNINLNNNLSEINSTRKDDDQHQVDFVYKEGGFGWVVVIATGYCFGVLIGMINNYALILNEFERVYNNTENHVIYSASIGSVSLGIQYFLCAFGSILTDFFGTRKIAIIGGLISFLSLLSSVYVKNLKIYFITYSVFFGAGQALLITSTLAILPHYFNKKLSLANGVMNALAAIIVVILPVLTSEIIKQYSLVGLFYFLSGLNLITVLMAFTYKPLIKHDKSLTNKERIKHSFGKKILKKKGFIVWCIASCIASFGWLIPIIVIDHHSIHIFPDKDPVIINVLFGVASGLSALIVGKIGDMTKFNHVHYHTIGYLIYGLVQITLPYTQNFNLFLFQLFVLGLCDGILLCFIVPISLDLAGSPKLANHAAGYYHVMIGPSTIFGPVIAGKIFQDFHKYEYAFYFGGSTCLLSSLILILYFFSDYYLPHKMKKQLLKKELKVTNELIYVNDLK